MLLVATAACDNTPDDLQLSVTHDGLNGRCELVFNEPVRALSVTPRSVLVATPDGEPLDVRFEVNGARVALQLVLHEGLVARPPSEVQVTVLGGASVHAVTYQSARRAEGAAGLVWRLDGELRSQRREGPQILTVDVASADGAQSARVTVDGVLDPASLDASERAWIPMLEEGLDLDLLPVGPLTWRIVGETTEVDLRVPSVAASTRLQFDPRRVRWMDVLGRRLRAALPVDIEIDSGFSDPVRPR